VGENDQDRKGILLVKISQKTAKTLIFFNNCHAGSAAKNAAQMAKLLTEQQS